MKKTVKELLDLHNAYYFMPVQAGFGQPGLDFYCCVYGCFVAVETKAHAGQKPTVRQEKTMRDIMDAGGIALCVAGIEQVGFLQNVLAILKGRPHHVAYTHQPPPSTGRAAI